MLLNSVFYFFHVQFFMTVSPCGSRFYSHIFTLVTLNYYRYKEESDQSYFEGTGYASVTSKETNANTRIRYEQTIQTTADEGIVFFAANEVIKCFCVV